MPIISKPYYLAKCDGCGDEAEYDDFSAFGDASDAETETLSCGWTTDGKLWHCEDCPKLGSDDGADL